MDSPSRGDYSPIMNRMTLPFCCLLAAVGCVVAQPAKPLFKQNFEDAKPPALPADFLVLEGEFTVKAEGANKFLELPGSPLDTFGVLFGPTAKSDVAAESRFFGTGKGRRFPSFGIGLNGVSGYKLMVVPSKKALEILRNDEIKATVPFAWESGKWAHLRISIVSLNSGKFLVAGKAWQEGAKEPADWNIRFLEEAEPAPAGRASIWGSPYSGTPILFDDLLLTPASKTGP